MKKRWLGILLTICMVLTLLPTAAWAEGETGTVTEVGSAADLKAAIETSTASTVKLTAEIELTESLTVSRTVTLDLNNHVLTITGEDSFITVSGQNTTLTLTDSAETKSARQFTKDENGVWTLAENGDKTVTGGVITGGKTGADLYGTPAVNSGVCIENHGTLTVTDGTVSAPIRNKRGTIAGSGTFNGTVINEDKLTGGIFNGPVANYKGQYKADTTISGGIFYGTVANGYNYYTADGEVALDGRKGGLISGGTFYGKVTNAFQSTISGGSFYGEVDNRDRSEYLSNYLGILAGGTFYSGKPGTIADGCYTVTFTYPTYDKTYAIQIVQEGKKAVRPADPKRSDFTFDNWYYYDNDKAYDFAATVTEDMTLYGLSTDTSYGIRITDKDGNAVYVTSKNANDVLGDGTVSYTPGYWNREEIPTEYWNDNHTALTKEAQEKLLAGEEIPGIRFPKLTLNGAKLQEIEADAPGNITIDDWLLVELKGENRVSYSGTQFAIYWNEQGVLVTGDGSLTVNAPNAQTAIHYGEGGAYVQRGGTVALNAKNYGFSYGEPMFCRFLGGRLTIQAGNEADEYSGVLHGLKDLFTEGNIPDSATFLLGDSAENCIRLAPPYTWENLSRQLETVAEAGTIKHEYYLSLASNHTVIFNSNGGSAIDTQTVPYGETAQAPTAPTRSGYTFDGWYLADGTKYDFSTLVTANLKLTAHWTRNSSGGGGGGGTTYYTLTFDTNGGSALSALRLARGSTVDLARYVPERSGHVFTGWYADAALTQPIERVTLNASTTVYAGWRAETNDLPFTDVGADAWYRDDVQYVYDKGLMTGTTADRFAPDGSMTRAMLVTVLWRQAGSPVVNYAMDFSDVAEGAWYAEAVRWAAAEGVVGGYGDGRFGPDDPITREQLATILFRHLVGDGPVELADWLRPYADADQISAYAAPAMQWAVGHGVLKGDGDRLDPQGTATRAQVAAVLHRALEL